MKSGKAYNVMWGLLSRQVSIFRWIRCRHGIN